LAAFHRSHQLRTGRVSQIGQAYHVTFTTFNRAPLLADFYAARAAVCAAKHSDASGFTHTSAMVVMPDHVHWLLTLTRGNIANTVRTVKSAAARTINVQRSGIDAVWQKGYYDHALRNEEALLDVARYIVANPLRAGLVARRADYPHWHAQWV